MTRFLPDLIVGVQFAFVTVESAFVLILVLGEEDVFVFVTAMLHHESDKIIAPTIGKIFNDATDFESSVLDLFMIVEMYYC